MGTRPIVSILILALTATPAMAADWANAPLLTAKTCDTLTYANVTDFMNLHYYPKLGWSSGGANPEIGMTEAYAISATLLTKSQVCLSEALGLKELNEQLQLEQAVLASGTSLSEQEMTKHRTLSTEADRKIKEAAASSEKLKPEQRKTFGLGTASYLAGTYAMSELTKEIGKFLDSKKDTHSSMLSGGFGMNSIKQAMDGTRTLNTVRKISTGVASLLGSSMETGKSLLEYSQSNDIKVPADATSKLGW